MQFTLGTGGDENLSINFIYAVSYLVPMPAAAWQMNQ